jgi:hypothetical protein
MPNPAKAVLPTPFFSPVARATGGYDWVQVCIGPDGKFLEEQGVIQPALAEA